MMTKRVGSGKNLAVSFSTKDAFDVLRESIKKDDSLAWSWHCNVAVASMDEGMEHKAANRAAARFMYNCFNVDITKFKEYIDIIDKNE